MANDQSLPELAKAVRDSESKKGRSYSGEEVGGRWLAQEIAEFCKTQAWPHSLSTMTTGKAWIVSSDYVTALIEEGNGAVTFAVADLNPVMLKTALVSTGLLALTAVGIVGLPLAGAAAWRASHRKKKVEAIVAFVDESVRAHRAKAKPQVATSVASRLKDLESLREQGLITDQEYRDKREQVLKQL
jgi:hypothetical protein